MAKKIYIDEAARESFCLWCFYIVVLCHYKNPPGRLRLGALNQGDRTRCFLKG